MKVLMVCLGNICRSPIAHGVLKHKAAINELDITVDSAGTSAFHAGELPDVRSIEVMDHHGIDIRYQTSRPFEVSDFDEFDLIYVMDTSNYNNVVKLSRNDGDAAKVKMIMNEVSPGANISVPDPYYGGDSGFENVYQMIDQACDKIIEDFKAL